MRFIRFGLNWSLLGFNIDWFLLIFSLNLLLWSFILNINRLDNLLLVMLMFCQVEIQFGFLLQILLSLDLSTCLHIHLLFELLDSLILNFDKRVVILLQAILVFIELFSILVQFLLGTFELFAHLLLLLRKLLMLLEN